MKGSSTSDDVSRKLELTHKTLFPKPNLLKTDVLEWILHPKLLISCKISKKFPGNINFPIKVFLLEGLSWPMSTILTGLWTI